MACAYCTCVETSSNITCNLIVFFWNVWPFHQDYQLFESSLLSFSYFVFLLNAFDSALHIAGFFLNLLRKIALLFW